MTKFQNHKLYKEVVLNNNNIHPGDLQRLPDDYFYYSLIILRWRFLWKRQLF